MTTKQYPQHQQIFKSGLIKNNFLGQHLIKFLYRDINKDVARKQYEIMKHISVNDWIKIEGYVKPNNAKWANKWNDLGAYEDYNDVDLARRFYDWTLYNNLIINLPPKKMREWVKKSIKGQRKDFLVQKHKKGLFVSRKGNLVLNSVKKPRVDKFLCGCWMKGYNQHHLNSLRRILSLMKDDHFSSQQLYNLLCLNNVKGRTKLKKQGKREMIKAFLKIKDLN